MRHARLNSRTISSTAVLLAGLALVGCNAPATTRHAGDIETLRSDPSPALHTLAERGTDRENRWVNTRDTNFRMISDDWDRLWMVNRPSRLSLYPTVR